MRIDNSSAVRSDRFVDGTTFDQVVRLYQADRRLKLLLLDAIERIEIAVRLKVGYTLGRRGAFAHLDPLNLDGRFVRRDRTGRSTYSAWLDKVLQAQRRSSEDFVRHFRAKYNDQLPVWVATEIMDFGSLAYLYGGLRAPDRDEVAAGLNVLTAAGLGNGAAMRNWLRVLNYVRNICAHHSRLWNRNLTDQLAPSHLTPIESLRHLGGTPSAAHFRVYSVLCVLAFLLTTVASDTNWPTAVRTVLADVVGADRELSEMGFPDDWADHAPWLSP